MNIYVGNLSKEVKDEDLRQAFSAFGQVESAKVICDMFSHESKGFGFVEMQSVADGQKAVRELNSKDLKGKEILVNEARPKTNNRSNGTSNGYKKRW
jgi:RNA recognition motif-containing protein